MPKTEKDRKEVNDGDVRPLEKELVTAPDTEAFRASAGPFETRLENLPQLRDLEPGVRPFEVQFENLPAMHDAQPGVRPFELSQPFGPSSQALSSETGRDNRFSTAESDATPRPFQTQPASD